MMEARHLQEGNSTEFEFYEPSTADPGWSFTILTMIICTALNVMLPLMLRIRKSVRRKKASQTKDPSSNIDPLPKSNADNEDPKEEVVVSQAKDSSTEDHPTPNVDDDSDIVSQMSIESSGSAMSILSDIVAGVLDAQSKTRRNRRFSGRLPAHLGPAPKHDESDERISDGVPVSIETEDAADTKGGPLVSERPPVVEKADDLKHKTTMEKLFEIADFDYRTMHLLKLFFPYWLQAVVGGVLSMLRVSLIGYYIGVQEANVKIVVDTLMGITDTLVYGFSAALGTLAPQASGAGNNILAGRYLQLSIILYTTFSIPSVVVWGLWTDKVVLWFGFDEETAAFAQRYVYPYLVGYVVGGLDSCLFEFLEVIGHEKYATALEIGYKGSKTLIYVVMVALGYRDLMTIQIVKAVWSSTVAIGNISFVVYRGWLDDYWEGLFLTFSLKDRRAVHTMMITALPLTLSYILTYGEWEVLTLFARYMGPAEVATWGLLGYLWGTFEDLVSALSSAAEVRVGFRLGEGRPDVAKMTAYKAVYLGTVMAVFSTGLLYCFAEQIPTWLTPDPTLQRMIFETLPLIGFGQISMSVGNVLWNIVEAQGRVRLATLVEIVTSWCFVVPFSALFLYLYNFNLLGTVAALVIGYTIGGIWISYIVLTSDWNLQSKVIIERNGSHDLPYKDYTWDRLPNRVAKAAELLGYTNTSWDTNNTAPPLKDSRTWGELSNEERDAARCLGYNKTKWESNESDSLNGKTCLNYDNYYWRDLPPDVQAAAAVLGYNRLLWDKNGIPASEVKGWQQLQPDEQEAARTLGYSDETWDGGDSASISSQDSSSSSSEDLRVPKRIPSASSLNE